MSAMLKTELIISFSVLSEQVKLENLTQILMCQFECLQEKYGEAQMEAKKWLINTKSSNNSFVLLFAEYKYIEGPSCFEFCSHLSLDFNMSEVSARLESTH